MAIPKSVPVCLYIKMHGHWQSNKASAHKLSTNKSTWQIYTLLILYTVLVNCAIMPQ